MMEAKEVCKMFRIDMKILNYYQSVGILNGDGEKCRRYYKDEDLEKIALIRVLMDAGLYKKDILLYFDLLNKGNLTVHKRINILKDSRKKLLANIHYQNKSLNKLDYLIYELEKER